MSTSNNYDLKQIEAGYHMRPNVVTAPPAPTYYNPDIPPPQHNETSRRCKEILCFTLIVFVIVGFVASIFWVILDNPNYHVADFRVNAISIPNFDGSSTSAVNWNVDFVVDNPTKHKIVYFDPLTVTVYGHNGFLGETTTNSLVLNWYSTPMTAQFATPGTIMNQIYNSWNGMGRHTIYLNIYVDTKLRFGYYGVNDWRIQVSCENVMVGYPEGTLHDGPKNCSVRAY